METMSKRWAITNCTSGTELGIYAGETREEAIDALDLDAGYTRGDIPEIDAERDAGSPDLIVREVDALAVALVAGDRDELLDAIRTWCNCAEADISALGDVWIAEPQAGHWLSAGERTALSAHLGIGAGDAD